jgi:multidrug resistance efflux pump
MPDSFIPIPHHERWRSLRLRFLPLLVFAATIGGIALLWREAVVPPTFVGAVEHIESRVASAEAGTVTELHVHRFQLVTKGTPVAVVEPVGTRILGHEVAVQRLRLPWLQQKVDLATAESNLQFAEIEYGRAQGLAAKKVISAQEYELIQKKRQALQSEVEEKKRLVADLERQIGKLQAANGDGENPAIAGTSESGDVFEAIAPEPGPGRKILTAPIDGMISVINRRAGESVTAGEAIAVIIAPHSSHVVGYLREPIPVQPEVGMEVQIRTRDAHRTLAYGRVTRVGVAFEPVAASLQNPLLSRTGLETGLPVQVSLPAGMRLRPGGIVDMTLVPGKTVVSGEL